MIRLPKALLEEIGSSAPASSGRSKGKLSRKDNRKLERIASKKQKAQYHAAKQPQERKRPAREAHGDAPVAKKPRVSAPSPGAGVSNPKPKKKTPLQKLADSSSGNYNLPRTREEDKEDEYIRYLEGKLGWKKNGVKTSAYGSGLADDGLDELLANLDSFESSAIPQHSRLGTSEEGDSDFGSEIADEFNTKESNSEVEEGETTVDSDEEDHDEWTGFGHSSEVDEGPIPPSTKPQEATTVTPPLQSASKYVPPHLRNATADVQVQSSESLVKLTRQLKGLLNRLSEQNISSILDGVEEAYRNHSRNDITSTLTTLIVDSISSYTTHLESYVVLYAAFVAGLYRMIGIEFAAYFVQSTVSAYEEYMGPGSQDREEPGKEASNLIVLVSELYNFQVISCILIYDLVRDLLNQPQLPEYNVELLLKIVKNSGLQLRQDDPSALRDIIQLVHAKVPERSADMSSRAKFMVETLSNLKNNKVKKAIGGGASGTGAQGVVERLKKFLSGMNKNRHVKPHEPLRVTLGDLRSAENRGKWWLVGAAWNGDPLAETRENTTQAVAVADQESQLLKLARKQGMNTDIRRGIFVVLMSSEDYVDACERLGQLNLTEVQQREIVRVILHCCGNEKAYNPYYTLVCQELCRFSHSHRITLQFCLWDFLRELGEKTVGGVELLKRQDELGSSSPGKLISRSRLRNTARAYSWWVAKDCCSLNIFKPVDFTVLKDQTRDFLKEFLLQLFIDAQISTPSTAESARSLVQKVAPRNRDSLEEIFRKASVHEGLRAGLHYFVRHVFKKDVEEDTDGFVAWAAEISTEALGEGL